MKDKKPVRDIRDLYSDGYTYVDGVGFQSPPPVMTQQQALRHYANGLGICLLLYLLLSLYVPLLLFKLSSLLFPAIRIFRRQVIASLLTQKVVGLLSYAISLLAPFLLFASVYRIPVRAAIPDGKLRFSFFLPACCLGLGVSMLGGASSWAILWLAQLLGFSPVPSQEVALPAEWGAALVVVLRLCLLGPIVEELVFRGLIMGSLRRFGDRLALAASAVLFSLAHQNFTQLPNTLIMGLLLGFFVIRSNCLWTGIVMHMVNNTVVLGLSLWMERLDETSGRLLTLSAYGFLLAVGLLGFFCLLLRYPRLFDMSRDLPPERGSYRTFFTAPCLLPWLALMSLMVLGSLFLG